MSNQIWKILNFFVALISKFDSYILFPVPCCVPLWTHCDTFTQTWTIILKYTVSFFLSAFPSCANADLHTVVEVERHEATQLNCQYHSSSVGAAAGAASPPLEFRWSMNSSNDYVDIPKSQFTTNGDRSVLTFSAKTDMDFGTITCHATDAVGKASPPCTFQIIPKG